METRTEPSAAMSSGRRIGFNVLLGILAVFVIGFGLFSMIGGALGLGGREVHRIHDLVGGMGLALMLGVPAVTMFRNPSSKVAQMQFILLYLVAAHLAMAMSAKYSPFVIPFVVVVVVIAILHPARSRMLSGGSPSWPIVALTVAAAVPLVAYALGQAELQRTDPGTLHGKEDHWLAQASIAFTFILGGLLTSLRTPGFRTVGWILGAGAAIFAVGSLGLDGYPSALDGTWAIVMLVGAAAFVGLVEWEARRA